MLLKLSIISVIVSMSQSFATADECDSALICMDKKTVEFQVFPNDNSCQCKVVSPFRPDSVDGYIYTPGMGSHKFHTLAKTWNEARKTCIEEGAHLAVLNSKQEEEKLHETFINKFNLIKGERRNDLAWLGYHSLFDNNTDWVTILGDPLNSLDFIGWYSGDSDWGVQPDNLDGTQHCAALIRPHGMMDDIDCQWSLAFFCERLDVCS